MAKTPLFDRHDEWASLSRFAKSRGPALGIVHGRRRQGKSFLLRALSRGMKGLYHQGLEEERAGALLSVGATIAKDLELPIVPTFRSWDEAVRAFTGRTDRLVVLDEFPFLANKAPELESVIQRLFDEARGDPSIKLRLLLCGSAVSVMTGLLSGARPLRGRATLDLSVQPFDFRAAAKFWKIKDPQTAFLVHAVVGGTPGYRDLWSSQAPPTPAALTDWLAGGVLDPSHALFSEADYLLTEDPAISDRALYQSTLSTITRGANTQREIGGRLGRTDQAMQHPLLVLERAGFIRRDADVLLSRRPLIRLVDPMLRFHHAIIRPDLARFEARRTHEAWKAAASRFEAQILGPHFEQLAREWTVRFASRKTLGGVPERVGFAQINDPAERNRFEIDVVALGRAPDEQKRPVVLAIGEAKGGPHPRGMGDLARLDGMRSLLASHAVVDRTRLMLFSRAGFKKEVMNTARSRDDIELVGLDRLYGGE